MDACGSCKSPESLPCDWASRCKQVCSGCSLKLCWTCYQECKGLCPNCSRIASKGSETMADLLNPNLVNGVTLRDWFAGLAMQATMMCKGSPVLPRQEEIIPGELPTTDEISKASYAMADAMLKHREETRQK